MIRIILPAHLRALANVDREVAVAVSGPVTIATVLDALEEKYPVLRGTVRDHVTKVRRPMVRFFACEEDVSHQCHDLPLPEAIARGKDPLFIMGAIAGG